MRNTLSKKTLFSISAVLLLAGTAAAAAIETSADATINGRNWRGRHFAPFEMDGDVVSGKYVQFVEGNGSLSDYTILRNGTSRVVFSSVTLSDAFDQSGIKGALYGAGAEGQYRLAAFDARNAALFVSARNETTLTFVVADGIAVEYYAGEPGWSPEGVLLRDGDHTARIVARGDANVSVDGQTVTVTLGEGGSAAFHLDGKPRELLAEKRLLHKLGERARHGA